jgi:hypothetical protein
MMRPGIREMNYSDYILLRKVTKHSKMPNKVSIKSIIKIISLVLLLGDSSRFFPKIAPIRSDFFSILHFIFVDNPYK